MAEAKFGRKCYDVHGEHEVDVAHGGDCGACLPGRQAPRIERPHNIP